MNARRTCNANINSEIVACKRVLRSNSLLLNSDSLSCVNVASHLGSDMSNVKRSKSSFVNNPARQNKIKTNKRRRRSSVVSDATSVSSQISSSSELQKLVENDISLNANINKIGMDRKVSTQKLGKMNTDSRKMENENDMNASYANDSIVTERDLLNTSSLLNDPKGKLLSLCNQSEPKMFLDVIDPETSDSLRKIGEGVYGEVFMSSLKNLVIKIIPIEGEMEVNGEKQMSYANVYSEIYVSKRMAELSFKHGKNRTVNFTKLERSTVVKGKLPDVLVRKWREYRRIHGSENECLDFLPEDQEWVILFFKYGGIPLANIKFNSYLEAKSVFEQVAISLAVAENALQFEHRDLHWFNILVHPTKAEKLRYKLNGCNYVIPTNGLEVTIIDFTVSRLCYEGNIVYLDMADSSVIFSCYGDYQYDIYRIMKYSNNNKWRNFNPITNLYWVHYLLLKLTGETSYPRRDPNMNCTESELRTLVDTILSLNYESVTDFVSRSFYFDAYREIL